MVYVLALELHKTPDEIRALPVPDFMHLVALLKIRRGKHGNS